jgi:hypothetical protein
MKGLLFLFFSLISCSVLAKSHYNLQGKNIVGQEIWVAIQGPTTSKNSSEVSARISVIEGDTFLAFYEEQICNFKPGKSFSCLKKLKPKKDLSPLENTIYKIKPQTLSSEYKTYICFKGCSDKTPKELIEADPPPVVFGP